MEQSYNLLAGITHFAAYFGLSLVALVAFKFLYALVTPHDEWKLIREQKNTAAAIGLGGAVVGFSIALAGAASNSVSLLDFGTWALVALVAQVLAFAIVRFVFMPRLITRIEEGEVSAGAMLAAVAIAVGLLNAACMSY
jgi:putative membrane protein